MSRYVVIRDAFGGVHAAAVEPQGALGAAGYLASSLGLDSAECSPLRIGTVEASDAGAARLLPSESVEWICSVTFEGRS